MSLREPQEKDINLIKPGEHLFSAYTGTIEETFVSSSQPVWSLIYYYNNLTLEHKNELQSYLARIGAGNVTIPLFETQREAIPSIAQISKGNLITAVNRDVITIDPTYLGGRTFLPGDLLQVSNHCLHIHTVSGNDLTVENLPEDFEDLPDGVHCSTARYQIVAKRVDLNRRFIQHTLKRFESPPLNFIEVI